MSHNTKETGKKSSKKTSKQVTKKSSEKTVNENKFPWQMLKKAILILILLAMGIYVGCHTDQFWVKTRHVVENSPDSGKVDLLSVKEVDQEFVAQDQKMTSVMVVFEAKDKTKNSGIIHVSLRDQEGNVLAEDSCEANQIVQIRHKVKTEFMMDASLKIGEIYHIVISGEDLKSPEGIYLKTSSKKGKIYKTLYVDGNKEETRIKMSFNMMRFQTMGRIGIFVILFVAILFICLPMDRLQKLLDKKMGKKKTVIDLNRWFSRLFFVASPVVAFFIVQRYSEFDIPTFRNMLFKFEGIVNLLMYCMIFWLIYIICNRTKYTAALTVAICSLFGMVNYFVWQFRGAPIMAADLSSMRTAGQVAAGYKYVLEYSGMFALACTLAFVCMVLSLKNYKGWNWKMRILVVLLFFLPAGLFYKNIVLEDDLKRHELILNVWNPASNYAEMGSLLSFYISYTYYTIDKPEGYSVDEVQKIMEGYESDAATPADQGKKPNIIVVMNETFADLSVLGDCETTEDVMPFVHSLRENTVKGHLYMSVLGGNTANSEFEYLTGCSIGFLPFRSIAYENYIHSEFPSFTNVMKEDGYCGHIAVHPGERTAWNRDVVYPYLGFDEFYSKYEMDQLELLRGRVNDKSNYDFMIRKYEEARKASQDPFYLFDVTIQNHGGYNAEYADNLKMPISFKDESLNEYEEAIQYINLIRESDRAFEHLIDYYSKVEEPTVIVFFGDHLPKLPDEFYEAVLGKELKDLSIEEVMKQYTVPYVIWANYDIEEKDEDMSANYLSSYVMQTIGGNMTAYEKWLMDLREELPAYTANGYQGKDGVWHAIDEKSEYSDLIHQYQILQYNNMMDNKHRCNEIYHLK